MLFLGRRIHDVILRKAFGPSGNVAKNVVPESMNFAMKKTQKEFLVELPSASLYIRSKQFADLDVFKSTIGDVPLMDLQLMHTRRLLKGIVETPFSRRNIAGLNTNRRSPAGTNTSAKPLRKEKTARQRSPTATTSSSDKPRSKAD